MFSAFYQYLSNFISWKNLHRNEMGKNQSLICLYNPCLLFNVRDVKNDAYSKIIQKTLYSYWRKTFNKQTHYTDLETF